MDYLKRTDSASYLHSDDYVQHMKHMEEERRIKEELIQKQKDREHQKLEDERREQ